MRSLHRTLIATAVLILPLLAACSPEGDAEEISFDVPVVLETAKLGRIERTLTTTGTVEADREARLVTPVGGKLHLLRNPSTGEAWSEGDAVRSGTVVAVVESEEQTVGKSSGIAAKKARLEAAEAELERKRRLYEEKIISESDLKTAESEAATARYDYEQALIVRAQTRVESPIEGVLTEVTRSGDGERVAAGTQVAKVVDFDRVEVDGRLSASDLAFVEKGQRARVTSYSFPDEVFEGEVTNVSPTVDPETRTFLVEVKLPNPQGLLRPGLFVKMEIVVEERQEVVVVPKDAVVLRKNRPVVFVVERQVAKERPIMTGLDSGERIEVAEGLEPDERYVIVGQQTLADNTPVRPR